MNNYLNLGCGNRYYAGWTNVDLYPANSSVIKHDLRKPLPFESKSFDLVYHSHVLEHFSQDGGAALLAECFRVLRPNGVFRVAVPDLEQIARHYLAALEQSLLGKKDARHNYDWMMLEMYDQVVRNSGGGRMGAYLLQNQIPNKDFVLYRLGSEARKVIERPKNASAQQEAESSGLNKLFEVAKYPERLRRLCLRWLLGDEYRALELGRFKLGGENHQWMYDRFSLGRLLERTGYRSVVQRDAKTSYIEQWPTFNLDTEPDGSIYKPDSLLMEGIRPE